jgi:flagellar protein FliS
MYANANAAYLESRVHSADPVELVRILYESASGAVTDARRHLAAGAIAERSRSINKACAVLAELISSLDRERGGEIAQRLGQLYDYMYARLIEANRQQADAPLADVLGLLATLSEAWEGAGAVAQPAAAAEAPGARNRGAESYGAGSDGAGSYGAGNAWAPLPEPAPAQAYGSHAWSF